MDRARRYRRYVDAELDGAAVYRALAERSTGERRAILHRLATAEERHAAHWADELETLGEPRPDLSGSRASWRARLLSWIARRFGVGIVVPLLERGEAAEIDRYDTEPAAAEGMAVDERIHARIVANLFPTWRTRLSGSVRAGTFGVNDGLVSNLALVMGVAGAQAGDAAILVAGLAGLLGGGLSMGIGEWISVTTQRELWEGTVELDAYQVESLPEDRADELAWLFRAKGASPDDASAMAEALRRDPQAAAHLLASEKLGFDPQALGSPWGAALSNFGAFVAGAAVPVLPYVITGGTAAFVGAIVASAVSLFAVGAVLSLLTYRPMALAGARQLAVGAGAAAATYVLGTLLDAAV